MQKFKFMGLSLALLAPVTAAQAPSLVVDVGPCITLETAVERYTCYENQVDAVLSGGPGTQGSTNSAAPRAAAPPRDSGNANAGSQSTARSAARESVDNPDDFGFPREVIEQRRGEEPQQPVTEVHSVIAELEQVIPHQYIITLENGQVWRQSRPAPNMRLQAGHHVRIYPTRWGDDMRMSVEELNGFVQVSRLR